MSRVLPIPPATLEAMSTAGLIDTVLRYPFLGDWPAFNTLQHFCTTEAGRFNGVPALLARADARPELRRRYASMDSANVPPGVSAHDHASAFIFIQLLLMQDEILAGASQQERADLLEEARSKLPAGDVSRDTYGYGVKPATDQLIDRLLNG